MNGRLLPLWMMVACLGLTREARAADGGVAAGGSGLGYLLVGVVVGGLLAAGIAIAVTLRVMRRKLRAKEMAERSAAAFARTRPTDDARPIRATQKITDVSAVVLETIEELRNGREIHELGRQALADVVREAQTVNLAEIGEDTLREKIVRCVLGNGVAQMPSEQAAALWGCVLSWNPSREELETQATDMLGWSCEDAGDHPNAKPIMPNTRHDIPIPERMVVNRETELVFDRHPNTLVDEGASASVFRAHVTGGRDVAVKVSRLVDYGILRNTLTEYLMLRRAQGIEGVIRVYGAGHYHVGEDVYFFIVEEMAQMTLAGEFELRKASGRLYSEKEVRDNLVKPLLVSLEQLHERGIIHRDLKPKNIYRVDGAYKIGDFEIAAYSGEEGRALNTGTFAGSPAYTTAGAMVGRYGPETDINAVACISHMLLRGELPAMEDAPGTSTLIRGIRGETVMSEDERLRQDKAKRAVLEWITQKRGFVTEIKLSLRSTPFERFFIAPIMTQGLYSEATPGSILTARGALEAVARVERAEEAQETRKQALELARRGDFTAASKLLIDFDARFNRRSPDEIEVSMHVMIGDTLKAIEEMASHPGLGLVLPGDNGERFINDREVDSSWRYHENGRAVGYRTDSICRVSRDKQEIRSVCPRVTEPEAARLASAQGRNAADLAGKFRQPENEIRR